MHLDVHALRDFYYRSHLGRAVQKAARPHDREMGAGRRLTIAGYGFAVPCCGPSCRKLRVIGSQRPCRRVMHWPADGDNHSVLCDEALAAAQRQHRPFGPVAWA
ncbi:MAG: hypothetical protein R3D60_11955 [Paracoccaceae bacterium]